MSIQVFHEQLIDGNHHTISVGPDGFLLNNYYDAESINDINYTQANENNTEYINEVPRSSGIYMLVNIQDQERLHSAIRQFAGYYDRNQPNIEGSDFFGRFVGHEAITYNSSVYYIGKAKNLRSRLGQKYNNDRNAIIDNGDITRMWPSTLLYPFLKTKLYYIPFKENEFGLTLDQIENFFFDTFQKVFGHKILGNWRHGTPNSQNPGLSQSIEDILHEFSY